MANEGVTTVGSIDAKVGMDLDRWRAGVAEIQASARELGSLDPDITVDANTGRAQAAMAAVDASAAAMGASASSAAQRVKASTDSVAASEAKLAAAQSAADTAYSRVELAQMRLNELRDQGRTKASTLMAAEISLTEAMKRLDTANARATLSEEALNKAQQQAAASALEQAGAEDGNAAAITRTGNAASGGYNRMQLIIGAVIGLIALAGPLAAAAAGIGGGLAGMGAAGVLAIVGVVKAIKDGTVAGEQWSEGLHELKDDLNSLGTTAADRLLPSFLAGVQLIKGEMPELNSEIRQFSGILGGAAVTGLQGVLNLFRVGNPLFVQGAQVIASIAEGFTRWTEDGGLQKFVNYAMSELPVVVHDLGDISSAVIHVVTAAAPIGSTVLGALTAVANVINGFPTPVLGTIAGGALAAWAAFKLWNGISGIVDGVKVSLYGEAAASAAAGAAAGSAAGPIGLMVSLMGALAVGSVSAGQGLNSWLNGLAGHTRTVEQYNAEIAKGTLNHQQLQVTLKSTSGWMNDLTNTLSFGTSAQSQYYEEAKKLDQALASSSPKELAKGYKQLVETGKEVGVTTADIANRFPLATAALKAQESAAGGAQSALDKTAFSVGSLDDAETSAKNATDKFAQALQNLGGVNIAADQANIQYQQSLADLNTAVAKNGKTLDTSTQAGRDNMSALDGIASSAHALITAQSKAGTSVGTLTANMASARQSFIDAAVAAGETTEQANALADQYGLIPSQVPTAFVTSGAQDAIDAANKVKAAYDAIDRWVTIRVNSIITNSTNPNIGFGLGDGHAAGGTIRGPGSSSSDTAGLYPLSDGEEVTSNMAGQASRWRPLLKMINADAGAGKIAGKAIQLAGNQAPVAVAAQPAGPTHVHHWHITTNHGEQLYQQFMATINATSGP